MYESPKLSDEQIVQALAEQPKSIGSLTAGLSQNALRRPPAPEGWSLNDVLAHLRSCGDMWGKYIALILVKDQPTFRAVNPTTWIKSTNYPDLDFPASFRAYTKQRVQLVKKLRGVPKEAWSRRATVTGGGRPRQRTVRDYALWLANHERSHLGQIARLAAEHRR